MSRTAVAIQPKILEYFRTAPPSEAALMLSLVQAEVHSRTAAVMTLPPAKREKKAAKTAKTVEKVPVPNGMEQPGEAVPIAAIMG